MGSPCTIPFNSHNGPQRSQHYYQTGLQRPKHPNGCRAHDQVCCLKDSITHSTCSPGANRAAVQWSPQVFPHLSPSYWILTGALPHGAGASKGTWPWAAETESEVEDPSGTASVGPGWPLRSCDTIGVPGATYASAWTDTKITQWLWCM